MAYIKDYVDGIERDLQNVTANDGHPLVKKSILVQARKLGDIAEHNYKFLKEGMIDEIEELARFHAADVPVVHGDGTKSTDKMISMEELGKILCMVLKPENLEISEKRIDFT